MQYVADSHHVCFVTKIDVVLYMIPFLLPLSQSLSLSLIIQVNKSKCQNMLNREIKIALNTYLLVYNTRNFI